VKLYFTGRDRPIPRAFGAFQDSAFHRDDALVSKRFGQTERQTSSFGDALQDSGGVTELEKKHAS
jgi:hypothetical protein